MTTPTAPGLTPIQPDTRQGQLTLNGVSMCIGAWCVSNVMCLWEDADQRGTDRIIPGVAGVLSYPRRPTETTKSMSIVIAGAVDHTGTPFSDPFVGLETNFAYLTANVTQPVATGAGTVPGVLTMPSGATRSAAVHVGPLRIDQQGGPIIVAKFELQIPSGAFT